MVVVGLLVVVMSAVAAVAAYAAAFEGAKTEHWGVIYRNTIGSPVAELSDGPYVNHPSGTGLQPPFGKGSLGIIVGNGSEKVAFGNETDFTGDKIADLSQVGYRVFQTGEDTAASKGGLNNLPNITIEIDPNLTTPVDTSPDYTSMVWNPAGTAGDQDHWSPYIDARTNGYWYFTGAEGAAIGCTQAAPLCDFATAKAKLAAAGSGGTVLSVAIAKGRDAEFQGAVDGLRLNNKVYDFEDEPDGVKERSA
jgi:hypothetical protein